MGASTHSLVYTIYAQLVLRNLRKVLLCWQQCPSQSPWAHEHADFTFEWAIWEAARRNGRRSTSHMKQRDSKMPVLISFQMFHRFSTFFFVESAFSKLLKNFTTWLWQPGLVCRILACQARHPLIAFRWDQYLFFLMSWWWNFFWLHHFRHTIIYKRWHTHTFHNLLRLGTFGAGGFYRYATHYKLHQFTIYYNIIYQNKAQHFWTWHFPLCAR